MSSQYYKVTAYVGTPHRNAVEVTIPLVGPVGPTGPQGPQGDPGEVSGSIAWDNVTDKPSTFTPSAHTHTASEITDFTAAVEAVSPPADWDTLANKPSTFAPSAHTHELADITDAGTAAASDSTDFATSAQGSLADSAVQPGDLATVATSGDYDDLSNKPASFDPSAHASSHATAGSDPITPSDIGAGYALTIASNITITADTTLTGGRNVQQQVSSYDSTVLNLTLPETGNQVGDTFVLIGRRYVADINVRRRNHDGSGFGPEFTTVATVTSTLDRFTFRANSVFGAGLGEWVVVPVDTHVHAASAITSGTLTHERGGLEADVSAYNGLVKIASGSTSAVTVTSAGEALLDDADAAAQRTTLGLGTAAVEATTAFAASGSITSSGLTQATARILGRTTESTGAVEEIQIGSGLSLSAGELSATGSGVTAVGTTLADILSVSGSDLVADDLGADKLYGFDDSEGKAIGFVIGSGLSVSGDTISATASGGSKTYAVFTATDNQPTATAFATLDTRNSIAVLDFDDATDESSVFVSIIPEAASLGSGLKIRLHWMATTATSGDVVWDVSLERMTTDLDSDSFDTIASGTAAANGTSGILTVTEITLTTIDSVTAGDGYRLKVTRDANNASDTMTGDAELVVCEVRSAA